MTDCQGTTLLHTFFFFFSFFLSCSSPSQHLFSFFVMSLTLRVVGFCCLLLCDDAGLPCFLICLCIAIFCVHVMPYHIQLRMRSLSRSSSLFSSSVLLSPSRPQCMRHACPLGLSLLPLFFVALPFYPLCFFSLFVPFFIFFFLSCPVHPPVLSCPVKSPPLPFIPLSFCLFFVLVEVGCQ